MLFEILLHLLNLDFVWIIGLALDNIVVLFALFMLADAFAEGRGLKVTIIFFGFILYDFAIHFQFVDLVSWTLTEGSFLMIYYVSMLAISLVLENTKSLSKYLAVGLLLHGFAVLLLYNGFMG